MATGVAKQGTARKKARWPAARVAAIRELAAQGLTVEAIRRRLGAGWHFVRRVVDQLGIEVPPPRAHGDWDRVDWSLPNAEIARRSGYSAGTVAHWRSRLRKEGRPIPRGDLLHTPGCGTAERHAIWAERIRAMRATGKSSAEIAEALDVSVGTVLAIAREHSIPSRVAGARRRRRALDAGSAILWARLDWSLPDSRLARRMRVGAHLVSALRAELLRMGAQVRPPARVVSPATARAERERTERDRVLAEGIRPLAERGLSTLGIALRLGATWDAVRRVAASHGIAIQRRAARSPKLRALLIAGIRRMVIERDSRDVGRVRELAAAGASRRTITRTLGVSHERLQRLLRVFRIDVAKPLRHDWTAVDWSMEDEDIAGRLGVPPRHVERRREVREFAVRVAGEIAASDPQRSAEKGPAPVEDSAPHVTAAE